MARDAHSWAESDGGATGGDSLPPPPPGGPRRRRQEMVPVTEVPEPAGGAGKSSEFINGEAH